MTAEQVIGTAVSAAAGGFMGAFGYWLVVQITKRRLRPRLQVEFASGYPFRSVAQFATGLSGAFIRIRVKNVGHITAAGCQVFVRRIVLNGQNPLETEDLMPTNWVPREECLYKLNIPRNIDFNADICFEMVSSGASGLQPCFRIQNRVAQKFQAHVGAVQLDVVVIAENAEPVSKTIKFRFNGKSEGLFPEV